MYNGGSMTSPMIGEYCDSIPPDIITTSNEIFVHFLTSSTNTDIGFKLMYNPTSKSLGHFVSRAKKKDIEVGIFQSMTCDCTRLKNS